MHPFRPEETQLPIVSCIPEIKECLDKGNRLIVQAAPGAGKSTVLPLALLNEPWANGKKILMLEPRRLAAKTIATRMASLLNEDVGKTIGYRIKAEQQISAETRLEVLTEGILTRKLAHDNSLEDVGLLIFDEFHERSIHADLSLALSRMIQEYLRPDLRILIMSATLQSNELSALLKAPVVQSEGRQYPVDIHYCSIPNALISTEGLEEVVLHAAQKNDGDMLIFLPGEAEIKRNAERLASLLPHFAIHPLYSKLNPKEQQAAILPNLDGKRKIVLATTIAETSLTIEGIKIVVDTGKVKSSRFDPALGFSRLETLPITQDSADQRAGRAGRLGPGVCYRLWTSTAHARLGERRTPEILEAELCALYLELAVWGFGSVYDLNWIDLPPKKNMDYAKEILTGLGALDDNGRITPHGREIHRFPCHPRIAHMVIMAQKEDLGSYAVDIAALLEEKDPMPLAGPDINLRLESLRRSRQQKKNDSRFALIEKTATSYLNMFKASPSLSPIDPYFTGKCLSYAYPERVACMKLTMNRRFQLASGQYVQMDEKEHLAAEDWLAVAHLNTTSHIPRITWASPLNQEDIEHLVREKDSLTWDSKKGGFLSSRDRFIGSIWIQGKPIPLPGEEARIPILLDLVKKEGKSLLDWDEKAVQMQNRILSIRLWNGYKDWPDVKTERLMEKPEKWITPYLYGITKTEDFKKINLADVFFQMLTYEQQVELNEAVPSKMTVPSGSVLTIHYFPEGSAPVLAVRLQEVFGMAETPRINRGQVGIVLHLLSPGYKPVQITSNLGSFWNNTYYEVRNELRRRYPKHAWPDDPWSAKAVAKGRPTK